MNLRTEYPKYRTNWDEAHQKYDRDPQLLQIMCQHGHIYVHDATSEPPTLAASTNTRGTIAKKIASLEGTTILQDGDDGLNIAFPANMMQKVVKIIKPKTKRQLSAEHKAKMATRLSAYRAEVASRKPLK